MQFYTKPRNKPDNRWPDAETFYVGHGYGARQFQPNDGISSLLTLGWYWRPLGETVDPIGPFSTQASAIADAQGGAA